MKDDLKVLFIIILVVWSYFGANLYGAVAHELTKAREPWFSLIMLLGLAVSIYVSSLLSGVNFRTAAWIFVATGLLYLILRGLFGVYSATDMFIGPHIAAVLAVLSVSSIQNVHKKVKAEAPLQELRVEAGRTAQHN